MYIILTPKCSSVHISFLGKSNTNTWIFNLVGKINVFLKARIVAMIYYMVVKWAPPKNLMKFILNPSPSKLKGQIMTFWEICPLIEVFDLCTQSLPNLSGGVMHNYDLVWWEKTSHKLKNASWKCMQNRKVTRGFYLYLTHIE